MFYGFILYSGYHSTTVKTHALFVFASLLTPHKKKTEVTLTSITPYLVISVQTMTISFIFALLLLNSTFPVKSYVVKFRSSNSFNTCSLVVSKRGRNAAVPILFSSAEEHQEESCPNEGNDDKSPKSSSQGLPVYGYQERLKKMGIKPAIQNSRPKAVCPPDTEILPKEKSVSAPSTTLPDNSDASFLYSAMLEIGKIDSVEEFEKLVRLARVKDLKNLMLLQERSEQEDWLEKIESIYDQDIWQ